MLNIDDEYKKRLLSDFQDYLSHAKKAATKKSHPLTDDSEAIRFGWYDALTDKSAMLQHIHARRSICENEKDDLIHACSDAYENKKDEITHTYNNIEDGEKNELILMRSNLVTDDSEGIALKKFSTDDSEEIILKKLPTSAIERNSKQILLNNLFYNSSDDMEKSFIDFVKDLKGKPLFRDYLTSLIEQKRAEEALWLKANGKKTTEGHFSKDSNIYNASWVSKTVFSKITCLSAKPPNRPSKKTVAALTIGLRLNLDEAKEFYYVAGFSLGETEFYDILIRYAIEKRIYKMHDVNYLADMMKQDPLGETPRDYKFKNKQSNLSDH